MTTCQYHPPWVSGCSNTATHTNPPRCDDHADTTCIVCDAPAVKGCSGTISSFVCGQHLCADHGWEDCPFCK